MLTAHRISKSYHINTILKEVSFNINPGDRVGLVGPNGCGKTTLLAALYSTFPDLSLAWLTLDEEDNDLVRFLSALIVALKRLNPKFGTTAQSLLTSLPNPGVEARQVMSVLINDVVETPSDPFALILDDL